MTTSMEANVALATKGEPEPQSGGERASIKYAAVDNIAKTYLGGRKSRIAQRKGSQETSKAVIKAEEDGCELKRRGRGGKQRCRARWPRQLRLLTSSKRKQAAIAKEIRKHEVAHQISEKRRSFRRRIYARTASFRVCCGIKKKWKRN